MVESIELKFDMHIIDQSLTNPRDFGECRIYSVFFFLEVKKIILYVTAYSQIIKSILVPKRGIRLRSNLMHVF